MRHRGKPNRLSRFTSFRKATLRSITISVLLREKIITTKAKAKAARSTIEKVISLGKANTLASRRRAFALLCDHKLVKLLFDEIAPKFSARNGGYTRIIPYRNRRGDNAQLAVLELTETYKVQKPKKEPKKEKPAKAADQAEEPVRETKEEKKTVHAKEPAESKKKESSAAVEQPVKKAETPEVEEKQEKKFLGGFRGLFKKEKDSDK